MSILFSGRSLKAANRSCTNFRDRKWLTKLLFINGPVLRDYVHAPGMTAEPLRWILGVRNVTRLSEGARRLYTVSVDGAAFVIVVAVWRHVSWNSTQWSGRHQRQSTYTWAYSTHTLRQYHSVRNPPQHKDPRPRSVAFWPRNQWISRPYRGTFACQVWWS